MAARRLQFTPNVRPTSTRTPSKNSLDDAGLYLQQVIGTTSISSNGFAYLESARCFAFLAGAGAVLASVDDDLRITQRFYRAKSSLNSAKPTTPFYEPPTLPGAPQPLRRGPSFSKREGLGGLPSFGPSAADLVDSPGNRTSSLKERTKAASCVCLSPNGKILALGEVSKLIAIATSELISMRRQVTNQKSFSSLPHEAHHLRTSWLPSQNILLEFGAWHSVRTRHGLHR